MALPLHRDDAANDPNSFITASLGLIESVPPKHNELPSAGFCRALGFNNSELRARLQRGTRRLRPATGNRRQVLHQLRPQIRCDEPIESTARKIILGAVPVTRDLHAAFSLGAFSRLGCGRVGRLDCIRGWPTLAACVPNVRRDRSLSSRTAEADGENCD
jgi:hypothetical protein